MSSQKSKWFLFAAIACIGCCALPLYLIIAGASGLSVLAALMNQQNLDVLICLAPLVLIVGYFMYKRYRTQKTCCSAAASKCSSTQCDSSKP